ncbi:HRDC domain-containing protein [Treponema sp. OMZ 787]|uniref:HRDC domain-containing protein n=1 Tax=Treponema sp. OMZ 787 TaxID=2563669 RepID=UPI0020A61243|nr:HRDC domain-containing protein [Treponema sp. OMZ 787]
MAQLLLLIKYLRDERKKLAEQAGIPVYAVVTNAQLAQIAVEKPKSISELSKIEGICFTHYSRICPYCNKLL